MKIYRLMITIAAFLLLLCGCTAKPSAPHTITVLGTARVYAVPDEASLSFTLYTKDKVLLEAKRKNDMTLKKLKHILQTFDINQKNLLLDYTTITPEYHYHRQTDERILNGYSVRQNISIQLKDISRYEDFITALLEAGIDTIRNTGFGNSEIRRYRDEARIKAVEAAFHKAAVLCRAADNNNQSLKVSKVLHITEITGEQSQLQNVRNMSKNYAKKEALSDGIADEERTPLGTIPVDAAVEIVFELQ